MFKTSLTTCKIQIKVQILKNLILKHLLMYCMIRTVLRYDTIRFIWYAHCIVRFMSIYDMLIWYKIFYTLYNIYRMIRIAYRTILTTMVYSNSSFVWFYARAYKEKPFCMSLINYINSSIVSCSFLCNDVIFAT